MAFFITVNLQVTDAFGNINIVGACLDLEPSNIQEVINGHDGNTNVLMKNGRFYEILAPFMEIMGIIANETEIIANYKADVIEFILEFLQLLKLVSPSKCSMVKPVK